MAIETSEYPKYDDGNTYVLTGTELNKLVEMMQRGRARAGKYTTESQDGTNGTRINANPSSLIITDFSLYNASNLTAKRIGVRNGTVNGKLPIVNGIIPGMVPGSVIPCEFAVTGIGYVFLIGTFNTSTGLLTNAKINFASTVPPNIDGYGYQSLGDFNATGGILDIGSGVQGIGSQNALYCGGHEYFWQA